MMRLFDSHAHYWDDRFTRETENGVGELLDTVFKGDIAGIVNVGTSPETTEKALSQARAYPQMYVAAGIHPTDGEAIADISAALSRIETLIRENPDKIVAIGEIGLDYHFEPFDKEKQKELFRAQMRLAEKTGLPVIIHDRDAHGDTVDIVREFPRVYGVLHSYSGSPEMALDLVRRGYYISFSGTVSFKNARNVKEAASVLPHNKVLIETDCPYLAPHPFRGQLNHSGLLPYTCAALAEAWGLSAEETAAITWENTRTFFRLPEF